MRLQELKGINQISYNASEQKLNANMLNVLILTYKNFTIFSFFVGEMYIT